MQDPSTFQPMKTHFPEQEHLKCPRCESTNTKFCYYNNYNLSQPRHFCKNCRRYWTKGGALRNIPVGGGSRKNTKRSSNPKRPSSSSSTSSVSSPPVSSSSNAAAQKSEPSGIYVSAADQDRRMLDISGSFSSLLASNGQFGSLLESLNPTGSVRGVPLSAFSETPNSNSDSGRTPAMELQSNGNSENFWVSKLEIQAVGMAAMAGLISPFTHLVQPSSRERTLAFFCSMVGEMMRMKKSLKLRNHGEEEEE